MTDGVQSARAARTRTRWLAALLCWCALAMLVLPQMRTPPAPSSTLLLQSQPDACNAPPSAAIPSPIVSLATDVRVLSKEELQADAEQRLPYLPLAYWQRRKDDKHKFYNKKDCAPFPSIFDLEFHQKYWQTLRANNSVFYLYGAYLDVRNTPHLAPTVRMLAVHDRVKPTLVTHCRLWFAERDAPVVVRTLEYNYLWDRTWGNCYDGILQPYLLTCVLPAEVRDLVPASVSIVQDPCDHATNNIRVHYDRPEPPAKRKEFAVCVKGLDFLHRGLSARLVEWIELIRLLGADKIFFYKLQVHPNITKVLEYYNKLGVIEGTRITLPEEQPNPSLQHVKEKTIHMQQMEQILYNDCLYRHMYQYRWLALLDIDEVIVPVQDPDWSSLMKRILPLSTTLAGKSRRSSYYVSNLLFFDSLKHDREWEKDAPRYLHTLQQVHRTPSFTKPLEYVKAFYETDRVLKLHNHFPLSCLGGACSSYPIETQHATLLRYSPHCETTLSESCAKLNAQPERYTALWRWCGPLVARANAALSALGFIPPLHPPPTLTQH